MHGIGDVSVCQKASQSLPPAGGKSIEIIFVRGVYLDENSSQITPRPVATLPMKSCTLVTMVVADRLPRSSSLFTTNSAASTAYRYTGRMDPSGITRKEGVMLPVAMVCSMVARQITVVDLRTSSRMAAAPLVGVAVHLRQRPVVPDGAGQHEGHMVLHAAVDDAVVDVVILDKLRNGPAAADLVQHIQVVIVSVGLRLLGVDILAQCRVQQSALQIVGAQGVARQQTVAVAVVDQGLHGLPGAVIKGEGGAHDPHDVAVVPLVAQQLHQPVIVLGIGGLPAAALAEHELILQRLAVLGEAIAVHINAVLAVLGAAQDHPLALFPGCGSPPRTGVRRPPAPRSCPCGSPPPGSSGR